MNEKFMSIRPKKGYLISGICFLVMSLFILSAFVIGYLSGEFENTNDMQGVIIIVVVPSILCGIICFINHYRRGRNLRNAIQRYGEKVILSHVWYATIMIQPSRILKQPLDFFTDRFIYHKNQYLIDYQMIDWMYRYERKGRYDGCKVIRIHLINGEVYDICQWMKDENIPEIIKLCKQHNPRIITEYSKDYKEEHKRRVQAYKEGKLPITPMVLEYLTQPVLSKPIKKAIACYRK